MTRKTLLTPGGNFGARWRDDHALIEVWHMPSGLRAVQMHHFIRSLRPVIEEFTKVETAAVPALDILRTNPTDPAALHEVRRAIRNTLTLGWY